MLQRSEKAGEDPAAALREVRKIDRSFVIVERAYAELRARRGP